MPNQQEKAKRIIVGGTVAGVLLIMFLVITIIIQGAQIFIKQAERDRLDKEYQILLQQYYDKKNDLEYYSSDFYLEQLAYEYGYRYPSDK